MGKRSDFTRRERDAYDTPRQAVLPLIPHLPQSFVYVEPFAGAGVLVSHLSELSGGKCVGMSDIDPRAPGIGRRDALHVTTAHPEFVITNPPWSRDILHPTIEHFARMSPTWLLFDADWVHTKQAAPYLRMLRRIVSVGRIKWIADSPHTGKDNCAWHLFNARGTGPIEFWGRQ